MSRIDEIRGRLAAYRTPGGCTLKEYEAMKDHAAEDIAYLLGEVERLRGEQEEIETGGPVRAIQSKARKEGAERMRRLVIWLAGEFALSDEFVESVRGLPDTKSGKETNDAT